MYFDVYVIAYGDSIRIIHYHTLLISIYSIKFLLLGK